MAIPRSEADVLAGMMGADSSRIDNLVSVVGSVKGDVSHLRSEVGRVGNGVDELRSALTVLTRHSLLMEAISTDMTGIRTNVSAIEVRLRTVELEMPALKETRIATMRGVWGLVALVCIALLGLVLRSKGFP